MCHRHPTHSIYHSSLYKASRNTPLTKCSSASDTQSLSSLFFSFLVGIRVETTFSFNSFYYYYYKAQDKSALNTQRNSRCLTTRLFITQQWPQRVVVLLFSYICRDGKRRRKHKIEQFFFLLFLYSVWVSKGLACQVLGVVLFNLKLKKRKLRWNNPLLVTTRRTFL